MYWLRQFCSRFSSSSLFFQFIYYGATWTFSQLIKIMWYLENSYLLGTKALYEEMFTSGQLKLDPLAKFPSSNDIAYSARTVRIENVSYFELELHRSDHVIILTKYSSLAAPEVVILTTSGVASNENFAKMKKCPFQCLETVNLAMTGELWRTVWLVCACPCCNRTTIYNIHI